MFRVRVEAGVITGSTHNGHQPSTWNIHSKESGFRFFDYFPIAIVLIDSDFIIHVLFPLFLAEKCHKWKSFQSYHHQLIAWNDFHL